MYPRTFLRPPRVCSEGCPSVLLDVSLIAGRYGSRFCCSHHWATNFLHASSESEFECVEKKDDEAASTATRRA